MSKFEDDAIDVKSQKSSSKFEDDAIDITPAQRLRDAGGIIGKGARNIVPAGDALQHAFIDPAIGAMEGKSAREIQSRRENYEAYLADEYPYLLQASELAGDTIGMLGAGVEKGIEKLYQKGAPYIAKAAPAVAESAKAGAIALIPKIKDAIGMFEPAVNQASTHPESVGANLQTAASLAPVGLYGALHAPKIAARGIAFSKMKPQERASIGLYEKNPKLYDDYEARTGGEPRQSMVTEMRDNIGAAEADRQSNIDAIKDKISDARGARTEAATNQTIAKRQIEMDRRGAIQDTKAQLALGTQDGDAAHDALKEIKASINKTAEIRNTILDKTQGLSPIDNFRPVFANAKKRVILTDQKAKIDDAWRDFLSNTQTITDAEGNPQRFVTPRVVNEFRKKLQDNVNYSPGVKMEPWEVQYNNIANDLNSMLDDSIPLNNPLRNQLKEETRRYKKAQDLFGSEYNINKLNSAIRDPMMRRDLENLNIPAIDNIIKTVDARLQFDDSLARGFKPPVSSEQDYADFTKQRSDAVTRYMLNKKALEEAKKQRLPMTQGNVEPTLNSAMVSNTMHPRVGQHEKLAEYGANIHPGGTEAFNDLYAKNKVLRDLSTADITAGSKGVNLGKYVGTFAGGLLGAQWGELGAALGAAGGAYLDNNSSSVIRGLTKVNQSMPFSQARGLVAKAGGGVSKQVYQGIPMDRLAGTKYEAQMSEAMAKDPMTAAVTHYVMAQNDDEYDALVNGEKRRIGDKVGDRRGYDIEIKPNWNKP